MARYFPIVRTKQGEADALRRLSMTARHRITPIVNIVSSPSPGIAATLGSAWTGLPMALDGRYNHGVTGSSASFNAIFGGLGAAGVPVIPAISVGSPHGYVSAVQAAVGAFGPGLVVIARLADIPSLTGWVASNGWAVSNVDLVVSAGDVSAHDPVTYAGYVNHALAAIPTPSPWRSLSLHSFCAPVDLSGMSQGRNLVPRRDYQLWQAVSVSRAGLDYSDCGHVNASMEEPPGVAMASATVSVRYAIDDFWIVRKGVRVSGPTGQPMTTQYRAHAQALVVEPSFNAVPNCWADGQIANYAAGPGNAGGRQQWVTIGMNRHLSLVTHRLP
ncbi:beta family protein [Aquibium pacificus]|uniref:beta family protein n=1 Tax=Aquibium pacificus TaxID=3153579 RepID=UPI00349FC1CF